MCVIVFKDFGLTESIENIRACARSNSQGCGAMVTDGKTVMKIIKELSVNDFLEAIEPYNNPEYRVCMHHRIATSGGVNVNNIHPFHIRDKWHLFHNGIISKLNGKNKNKCDSWLLAEMLAKTNMNITLIDKIIEPNESSKFVVMNETEFIIINEQAGSWVNGIWYSNTSWSYGKRNYGGYEIEEDDYCYPYGKPQSRMIPPAITPSVKTEPTMGEKVAKLIEKNAVLKSDFYAVFGVDVRYIASLNWVINLGNYELHFHIENDYIMKYHVAIICRPSVRPIATFMFYNSLEFPLMYKIEKQ